MLELKNISKQFGQHKIFDNYNLTVEEGKILAIGRNHPVVVKRLSCVCQQGLESIDSGQIIYENEEIPLDQMESRKLVRFCLPRFPTVSAPDSLRQPNAFAN